MFQDTPTLPHAVLASFVQLRIMKCTAIATISLVIWDYFVLLPDEVSLIWPARWSLSKWLFLVNRYLAFVDPPMLIYVLFFADDAQVCVTTFRALGYVTSAAINVAQWILILRTYAVWGSKKDKRFFSLFTVYLGTLAIDHWACHRYQMGVHSNGVPAPAMTGCTLFFENRFAWVSFVLIIIVESALIGLLAFKAVEYFRFGGGSLMSVIYHDGLLYFACILATSIANLVVVLVAPAELHPFLIVAQRVLHSLLCSRILLRIRAAYQAQTLKGFDSIWIADTSPNQRATYNDEIGNIQFIDSETTTPTTV